MDIEKAKAVSQRDKDLIFGYIRGAQLLFPNEDNSYYNIPEIAAFTTILYFHVPEDLRKFVWFYHEGTYKSPSPSPIPPNATSIEYHVVKH